MSALTELTSAHIAPVSDQAARDRIATDLDTNMLVEAGAGAGKTTSLVDRMYALIVRGEPVDRIAAVTFTRKSAHELRERFQLKLEGELRTGDSSTEASRRCDQALRDLDRAFLGTIHSFCARILREHPLEVSLDPNFDEVTDEEWELLIRGFWTRWLERLTRNDDAALVGLKALGVDPRSLYDGFKEVMKYQDVEFLLPESGKPDGAACRTKLEALLARAEALLPPEAPRDGEDGLMGLVTRLGYHRRSNDWNRIDLLCDALDKITKSHCEIVQKRWSDATDTRKQVKALSEDFHSLLNGEISALLTCWREHRYPTVMRFLTRAATEFGTERHRTGQLGFEDLLLLSGKLLRDHPRVRDSLGARYRRLLVDEFQDTDPLQAEVCFLLASESSQGNDWRSVMPRAGAIFLVGDPKQSIYRFRRADIQVYELAKARMEHCGTVLALTQNFRSVAPIGDFVNRYFASVFPVVATAVQAPFSPMVIERGGTPTDGVSQCWVRPEKNTKQCIVDADSQQVASWIADQVVHSGRTPGDFLVLCRNRFGVANYARALAARNIAVTTSGAQLAQERELRELLVVLRAIADPDNPILVVAALEGLFFGCSVADLYDAHAVGVEFSITHLPRTSDDPVSAALVQLHDWWKLSQRFAADVLIERVLDDTGVLIFAASQSLGDVRAGTLLRLVEVLRATSVAGATGITDAMERIETLLTQDADDASLRPGRTDAVRIMNLHKAKGLEATSVILAAPVPGIDHPPKVHITRADTGEASGGVVITCGDRVVAQPVGWAAMCEAEERFVAAEEQRLLYVASTRAKNELVVSRCERPKPKSGGEPKPDVSAWAPFGEVLSEFGRETPMVATIASGLRSVEHAPQYIRDAITHARLEVERAAVASTTRQTVTESAKERADTARTYDLSSDRSRGKVWGRAVHRCIEAVGHGRTGASLTAFVAAVAGDEGLSAEQLPELERLVEEVRQSEVWARLSAGVGTCFELPVMRCTTDRDVMTVTEGIIDAATLVDGEWLLVDWKTDAVGDAEWASRLTKYEKQIDAYEQMLHALSRKPAHARIHRVRTGIADDS